MKKEKRFDHAKREFEEDGAMAQKHVHNGLKSFRLVKAAVYRMCKSYMFMLGEDHNKFLDMCESEGYGRDKESIDKYLDHWLQPMIIMGDDPRETITAIQKGMTLKRYLMETPGIFLARKGHKQQKKEKLEAPLPHAPPPCLSDAERATAWKARAEAAIVQLQEERSDNRKNRRRLAQLEKTVRKLLRLIKQAELPI